MGQAGDSHGVRECSHASSLSRNSCVMIVVVPVQEIRGVKLLSNRSPSGAEL